MEGKKEKNNNKATYKERRKMRVSNRSNQIYRCLGGFAEYALVDYPSC